MGNYIDISIKSADKVLNKTDKLLKFINSQTRVEEKTDGVKVTIIVKEEASSKNPYYENFIVSYKGNILYPEEFIYAEPEEVKTKSIGSSQFSFIWDMLKDVNVDLLPKGYQFFFEYLIKKPTLMSNYKNLYNLILLAYGPSKYTVKNGLLKTDNSNFDYKIEERVEYADIFGVYTPPVIFEGVLYPSSEFSNGIKYTPLKEAFVKKQEELKSLENDPELYWKVINNMFLNLPSVFGGKPEGYVFWQGEIPLKIQQEYQLSKEERNKVKMMYRADSDFEEALYWAQVKQIAENLVQEIGINTKDKIDLRSALMKLAHRIKKLDLSIEHPKKNDLQIKDDIQLTAKLQIIRKLADRWALIQGKFRVFTVAHKKLIDMALKKFDGVIINIVSNKETTKTKELREKVIKECFKKEIKEGRIEIVHSQTGNLQTVLNKSIQQVFAVYAGTDRVAEYQNLLKKVGRDIEVIELPRTDNISASNVIENLLDKKYFMKNTPKCSWNFYDDYIKFYKDEK